jgi:hypothetical protein
MDICYIITIITNTSNFLYFAKITEIIFPLFIWNKNIILSDVNKRSYNIVKYNINNILIH